MRNFRVLVTFALLLLTNRSQAAISGLQLVGSGLSNPAFATHAPGDPNRLFVAQLNGTIRIIDLNTNSVTGTFMSISDTDATGEGGLLGLAFHPNYFAAPGTTGRGKFYVYVTVDNGGDTSLGVTSPFSSHIREYTVMGDPATSNVADPATKKEILSFVQPQSNHNAGWIGFNPQVTEGQPQYLYIASGDGGSGFDLDPDGSDTDGDFGGHTQGIGNAQDITSNLLGKMLRIDIDDDTPMTAPFYDIPATNPFVGVTGDDEIWAYGLRNPFRDSFDRLTGDLWIGDVGQNQREEVDFQPASSPGGENYGWRYREGFAQTQTVGLPLDPSWTQPIYDYTRGGGNPGPLQGEAITGGYRYRGPDPDLQGLYFFGDSDFVRVWTMDPPEPVAAGGTVTNIASQLGALFSSINRVVSFAEDSKGNMYIVDLGTGGSTGEVYRILTNKLLAGDYNADGEVDNLDYTVWQTTFGTATGNRPADGNGNGVVDVADYAIWRKHLGASVHASAGGGASVPEPTMAGILLIALAGISALFRRQRML
ncbi:MAG: PQQ-dependent sugar dehydrogenase [Planctomycetes bacterium]|nr:PQQ-dependent sugar dehydrogenase [Planctomycetota bacterium]